MQFFDILKRLQFICNRLLIKYGVAPAIWLSSPWSDQDVHDPNKVAHYIVYDSPCFSNQVRSTTRL